MGATTAASTTVLAAPFVRTAHAAGRLSIGFWDHWVPGANDATRALVEQWAEKYPAGAPPQADAWTLEGFLKAANARHKAGVPFGIGLGRRRIPSIPPARCLRTASTAAGGRKPMRAMPGTERAGDERGLARSERRSSGARGRALIVRRRGVGCERGA
jgi:hypothetical protein